MGGVRPGHRPGAYRLRRRCCVCPRKTDRIRENGDRGERRRRLSGDLIGLGCGGSCGSAPGSVGAVLWAGSGSRMSPAGRLRSSRRAVATSARHRRRIGVRPHPGLGLRRQRAPADAASGGWFPGETLGRTCVGGRMRRVPAAGRLAPLSHSVFRLGIHPGFPHRRHLRSFLASIRSILHGSA